jgi:hypothetical protein
MKRRNFLASLAAIVVAPKLIEHVQQPGVDPRRFSGLQAKGKGGRVRCVRVGPMPSATWRRINAGVVPARPTYVMIEDDE